MEKILELAKGQVYGFKSTNFTFTITGFTTKFNPDKGLYLGKIKTIDSDGVLGQTTSSEILQALDKGGMYLKKGVEHGEDTTNNT